MLGRSEESVLMGGAGQMYELYDPCTVMFFYR